LIFKQVLSKPKEVLVVIDENGDAAEE